MNKRLLRGVAFAVVATGCFGDPPVIGPGEIVAVNVSAVDTVLAVGDERTFSAAALDRSSAFVVGPQATWTSNDPAVATVDADGVVLAQGLGTSTITATIDGIEGSRTVVVTTPAIGLEPPTILFSAFAGQSNPSPSAVAVTNTGPGTLNNLTLGAIQYGAGASGWLAAQLNASEAPASLVLTPTTGAIPAGSYTAVVPVLSTVAGNSPQNVTVTFAISPPVAPGVLAIITAPAGARANASFTTQPVIEIREADGTTPRTDAVTPVTASITSGTGVLIGTTTVMPVAGRATFTDLRIRGPLGTGGDTVGVGAHELTFTAVGSTDVTTAFNVNVSFSYNVQFVFGINFNGTCLGCHAGFNSTANLVGQAAALNAGCGTLVVASNAGTSHLMRKLDGTQAGGCGGNMPFFSPTLLSTRVRDVIRAWINEGAQNN